MTKLLPCGHEDYGLFACLICVPYGGGAKKDLKNERGKIVEVVTNWFFGKHGEERTKWNLGAGGIKEMKYFEPKGEGDRHHVDVFYDDGSSARLFNINQIAWENPKPTGQKE